MTANPSLLLTANSVAVFSKFCATFKFSGFSKFVPILLAAGELYVIAPRKARRILQGESPCREENQ